MKAYIQNSSREAFFEIFWLMKSTGVDDKGNFLPESSVYLIPPLRSTTLHFSGGGTGLIAFRREYLEEDDKEYALDVFNLFQMQAENLWLPLSTSTSSMLGHVVRLMEYEYTHQKGTYLALKALLKVFLLHLIRIHQNAFLDQSLDQKRIYEIKKLLDRYFNKERKVHFYAEKVGLSPKRLNQILLKNIKKTMTQLVHDRLVLEAKRKIVSSDLTIKEIAYTLNFTDHSYFGRFFKKQTGLSPQAYKASEARENRINKVDNIEPTKGIEATKENFE